MCAAFEAGVLTGYALQFKMYSRNAPIENNRYSLHMPIGIVKFQEYFRYQQNRQNRRQRYSKFPSCYTITGRLKRTTIKSKLTLVILMASLNNNNDLLMHWKQ